MRSMKMFRCVLVLGGVTAAYVSAGETDAKMDPAVTDFQTVFATWSARRDLADLFQVGADGHRIHRSFAFFGKPYLLRDAIMKIGLSRFGRHRARSSKSQREQAARVNICLFPFNGGTSRIF